MTPMRGTLLTALLLLLIRPVTAMIAPEQTALGYAWAILREALLWGLPAAILLRRLPLREKDTHPLRLLLMLPLGFALQWSTGLLTAGWLSILPVTGGGITMPGNPADAVLAVLAMVAAPAICEELFFRRALLTALSSGTGRVSAWLLSSLIFALAHGSMAAFPAHLLVGLLLGLCFLLTEDTALCIVLHGSYNAAALVMGTLGLEASRLPNAVCIGLTALTFILLLVKTPLRRQHDRFMTGGDTLLTGLLLSAALVPYLITASQIMR